jgi:hypothetical protein
LPKEQKFGKLVLYWFVLELLLFPNYHSFRIDSLSFMPAGRNPISNKYFPSMTLGLAGLRELIRRRRRSPLPPAAAAAGCRRPAYHFIPILIG